MGRALVCCREMQPARLSWILLFRYGNPTIVGYVCTFSKQDAFFQTSIAMIFNQITNYDFILPTETCQRHLETRAVNVWYLVQTDQSAWIFGEANEAVASGPLFQRCRWALLREFRTKVLHCFVKKAYMNHSRATFNKLLSKPYVFQDKEKVICKCAKEPSTTLMHRQTTV